MDELLIQKIWELMKTFPEMRFIKSPVDNERQLYERYPDGLERGVCVYTIEENSFYSWNFNLKKWRPVRTKTFVNSDGQELVTADDVVQTTGESETNIMSQKAVTSHIEDKYKHIISLGNIPNYDYFDNLTSEGIYRYSIGKENGFLFVSTDFGGQMGLFVTTNIRQEIYSYASGMAIKHRTGSITIQSITQTVDSKSWKQWSERNNINVVQTTGLSTTDVMSQKAVTEALSSISVGGSPLIIPRISNLYVIDRRYIVVNLDGHTNSIYDHKPEVCLVHTKTNFPGNHNEPPFPNGVGRRKNLISLLERIRSIYAMDETPDLVKCIFEYPPNVDDVKSFVLRYKGEYNAADVKAIIKSRLIENNGIVQFGNSNGGINYNQYNMYGHISKSCGICVRIKNPKYIENGGLYTNPSPQGQYWYVGTPAYLYGEVLPLRLNVNKLEHALGLNDLAYSISLR